MQWSPEGALLVRPGRSPQYYLLARGLQSARLKDQVPEPWLGTPLTNMIGQQSRVSRD